MPNSERFEIIMPEDPRYRDRVRGLTRAAWPEFMLHDAVANEHWHELLDRFAGFQVALYDRENDEAAAMANSFPLRWTAPLAELPDGGWDWAFEEAVRQHQQGLTPNLSCAIQVAIRPEYRRYRLSRPVLEALHQIATQQGFEHLIVPLRPSQKSQYPLTSIDDYVNWQNSVGLPFDAWLRVHVRAGAQVLKCCHTSKTMRGTVAEWETWTGLRFPQTDRYIIPDALTPIQIDREQDEGIYVEPNVWVAHPVLAQEKRADKI